MKVKTSVTLSEDLVREVDELAKSSSRSEVIEHAVREFLAARRRAARSARDIEIMNKYADEYNRETEDFLSYQTWIDLDE
jgi:metal-responsive CopG/Arc/MetJ family transcriptional regulator